MWVTWYVLENGNAADPAEVSTDADGMLRHSSGVAVAYRNGVPRSRGVDTDAAAKPAAPATVVITDGMPISEIADLTAPPRRGYKRNDMKAEK